ncbi:elks rab6-interacting cast family member 1 [Lasius niger]|uniref:Elks rab6-interacting cast family member 1 n=1 Tax=Lasius niger TaxID=67767 RepID=A0A0J7KXQ0_LASNI|nr:elks rab6-interacting cast family member 1 [Lasius niger]
MMVRQLEEELRMRMRGPNVEIQQQMEVLYNENEHLTREIAILRDTIKELELRIETQKQTLQARDESIKKLLEMLQNKGMAITIIVTVTASHPIIDYNNNYYYYMHNTTT